MTVIQAIVLGMIQGLTEFLPVSSSGHLVFVPRIFGWGDQGLTFDVVMHVGTLIAVIVYFRHKLWLLIRSFFARGNTSEIRTHKKLAWLVILSIIPAGIVGLFLGDMIESYLRLPFIIAVGLIFWAIVLFIADKKGKKQTALEGMSIGQMIFIACAQAIALIPGTSRSGITMTAGLFSGLSKKAAAEFSFLMSVPIIAIAGFMGMLDMVGAAEPVALGPLLAGFTASVASGFIAIWGLMKIIQKWSFTSFVVYRVIVGILILLFLV